ncbi:MAG: hypothetical protein KDE15_06630 [Erythrobacter sp.]|nr:hypothetical protein [Erythrobacter sp.]
MNEQYRFRLDSRWPDCPLYHRGTDIPDIAECARLARDKNSHRGVGLRSALRVLEAHSVNQAFLEEIGCLGQLTYLALEYPVTAVDLAPLAALSELSVLKIDSPRNITDFTPLLALPKLETLFIENARHMADIEWLRPLAPQLKVLGIEGSLYTAQSIPSLAPLAAFDLDALFLTGTRLGDQSLAPLQAMQGLKFLGTALNAPRAEFDALHAALPHLLCDWFRPEMWTNFKDPRPAKT